MAAFTVDGPALGAVVHEFLSVVARAGYLLPQARFDAGNLGQGWRPEPLFFPHKRSQEPDDLSLMYWGLRTVEERLNPDGLPYPEPERIARVVRYCAQERDRSGRLVGDLALAVDTIGRWWRRDGVRGFPESPDSDDPHIALTPLPDNLFAATWNAAARLRTPQTKLMPEPTAGGVSPCQAAKSVVLYCQSIADTAMMGEGSNPGHWLVSLAGALRLAQSRVPIDGAFWQPCVGSTEFEDAGVSAATAHQAAIKLAAKYYGTLENRARQCRHAAWQELVDVRFSSLPLIWDERASQAAGVQLWGRHLAAGRSPIDYDKWLTRLDWEAARAEGDCKRNGSYPVAIPNPSPLHTRTWLAELFQVHRSKEREAVEKHLSETKVRFNLTPKGRFIIELSDLSPAFRDKVTQPEPKRKKR